MHLSAFTTFIKQHRAECLCLLVFMAAALVGLCAHDPSFDEAQAWLIAKTAPWSDIVFSIPMDEGHPPFWHLLLAVPAKLGMGWQLVYPLLGLVCMGTGSVLILFKSPFPKWVRCLLPFSYFLFYQYGIIVRPYGLMWVILLLLAMTFENKDKRPGVFVGWLAALCACHVYGIAIAGGIALAWLWEIKQQCPWKDFLTDKRFHYLLGLLAFVVLITGLIFVPHNGKNLQTTYPVAWFRQLIYLLLAMPADAVLTDFHAAGHLHTVAVPWAGLLFTAFVGLLLWTLVLTALPKKRVLYLLLPYLCLVIPMTFYSSNHHIGLALMLFVWYGWISLPAAKLPQPLQRIAVGTLILVLAVPTLWSAFVLWRECTLTLFPGKQIVAFLQQYNLTKRTLFVAWQTPPGAQRPSPNYQPLGTLLNMYTRGNILANFNDGKPIGYTQFVPATTPRQIQAVYNAWQAKGLPDVIIGEAPLELVYTGHELAGQYVPTVQFKLTELWKLRRPFAIPMHVYIHQRLLGK